MAVDWQKLQILVADDQRFILSLIFQILKELGLKSDNIYQVTSAEEALKLLKGISVDVVLCDINMGPNSGLDLLKQIRTGRAGIARDLPFILLTAHGDSATVKVAAQLDANAFIVKPVAKRDLGAKIERVIAGRRPLPDGKTYESVNVELGDAIKAAAAMDGNQAAFLEQKAATAAAAPSKDGDAALRIAAADLHVGDVLAADVTTATGVLVAKAGTTLALADLEHIAMVADTVALGDIVVAPRKTAQA